MIKKRGIPELATAVFLVALSLALFSCVASPQKSPIRQGQITFPDNGKAIRLDGEWIFYPEGATVPVLQKVPSTWNNLQPAWSTGTYELGIQGLKAGILYSLQFKGLNTRAEIFIDGELAGSWGALGVDHVPKIYCFHAPSDSIQLTVAAENKVHAYGGLWMPVWFGTVSEVERSAFLARFFDILIFGFIMMMALYHFALFIMRPEEKSTLYFALFCIATVVKAGLAGEQILAILIPALSGTLGMRLAYLFTIILPIIFLAYLYSMFPRKRRPWVMTSLLVVGTAQSAISIFAPIHIVQLGFLMYQAAIMVCAVYVFALVVKEIQLKSPIAPLMMVGFLILLLATANDILHDQKIIITFYSIGLGLFLFLFVQSIVIGSIFNHSFREVKDLNAHLEQRVAERTHELEQLTRVDSLTNLINRRYFWVLLEQEWDRWIRYGQNFCLVMVDLDHFKDLNDTMGHAVGDEALRNLGKLLKANVRKTDTVARYGGEEFCLILPGTKIEVAWNLMEKIRLSLASEPLIDHPVPTIKTLSYGVAQASGHKDPTDLLDAADKLMYRAKEAGRNQGFSELG